METFGDFMIDAFGKVLRWMFWLGVVPGLLAFLAMVAQRFWDGRDRGASKVKGRAEAAAPEGGPGEHGAQRSLDALREK